MSQLKDEHKVKRMNLNVEVSLHNAFKAADCRPRREHDRHPDGVHRRVRQQAHAGCPETGEEGPLA